MPKAPPTPPLPLNGLFPVAKPSGPPSMRIIDALNPLLLESRLFVDPNQTRPKERNKRKKNATHMGLKIGQGGTLDPLADGVLVIGVNRGTKHLNRFLECTKEYESIGLLGAATTSYDSEGSILSTGDFDGVTREDVERVLDQFRGKIKQTPPIADSSFSALKMDGKPLYEYARESKPLPRAIPVRECEVSIDLIDFQPAQEVEGDGGHTYKWPTQRLSTDEKEVFTKLNKMVHDAGGEAATAEPPIDLEAPDVPEVSAKTGKRPAAFTVRMTVSSGTYVRSIVHDIGLALGCGAHVVKLTRTRQGEFVLNGPEDEALLDEFASEMAAEDAARAEKAEGGVVPSQLISEEEATNAPAPAACKEEKRSVPCVPWDVFERAIAERDASRKAEEQEREEARENMTKEEWRDRYGYDAVHRRNAEAPLKEWENEVLRRFVPVPLPVVRDSKSRQKQY
ncbi:pseudouridylate synthase 4 [Trichosporon asahii var. asahii CBS 2479]|uniref:tRNA pseudouridine(55) synthase n=1 Tax=Trichosporon asahii var. asahii (strain ATCC 90039 / CBS 2479 / JCM 2466 / KCTC 7840 / NBRC 103889/ NCYC 2677 / UAMH 7654) TaxID=1186058 RepID=J4U7S8_TRIAS|nr:pseudouridylate synthase 4 [Trichosporon asahii var. asahii CBS 2479]EJT46425.1 pseudouridylate synthase 4 [Trichosporon asahii var. asahii CBS 2479]